MGGGGGRFGSAVMMGEGVLENVTFQFCLYTYIFSNWGDMEVGGL